MTKAQIEAFKKITKGQWELEKLQQRPFGVRVFAGEVEIMRQYAAAYSSEHKTRQDCENAAGITPSERRESFIKAVEEQDANAMAIAALPDLLAEREQMIALLKEIIPYAHREATAGPCEGCDPGNEGAELWGELLYRSKKLIAEAEGGE